MTDIILCGCNGKLGSAIQAAVKEQENCRIVAGVDISGGNHSDFPVYAKPEEIRESADVLIDCSHPAALMPILEYCYAHPGLAAVLCTTGYDQEQTAAVKKAAEVLPIFRSANMSLGINLLMDLAKKAETVLGDDFDVEIVEMHHNQKIDAPSGTALMLADAVSEARNDQMKYTYDRHSQRKKREKNEIGLHSVRGGTIVGEHQIIFSGPFEVITLSHSAQSKELFASGAVRAALFMKGQKPGLYNMSDLI